MAPTSDERREVAERLRENASCSENSPRFVVESYLGIEYDGTDVLEESYRSESLLHLADLIDPTCHKVIPSEIEGYVFCSNCGAEIGEYGVPNYCHNCGARVVRDDDE